MKYFNFSIAFLQSNSFLGLIYNDGDIDKLPLFGMRASHKEMFKNKLIEKINESIKNRDF